jgi:predicted membrane protein
MENKSTDRKLIIGIILMLAGGLLLFDTFDITHFPIRYYIFSWKTLLIGIGIVILATKEKPTAGYILIGLGVIFWLPSIVNYSISLSQIFWPAVLIGIGILIITRRGRQNKYHRVKNVAGGNTSDYIDDVSILGGGNKIIQSKNFKGGDITAIFGGSEFNFKEAELSQEGCSIDVFTMFGGSKLVIPDNWVVKSDMFSIFGGFNDKRTIKPDEGEPTVVLYLKGAVIFGGMEIKSY